MNKKRVKNTLNHIQNWLLYVYTIYTKKNFKGHQAMDVVFFVGFLFGFWIFLECHKSWNESDVTRRERTTFSNKQLKNQPSKRQMLEHQSILIKFHAYCVCPIVQSTIWHHTPETK